METLDEILSPVKEDIALIEKNLATQIQTDIPLLNQISDYAFSSPGKRIRPALVLLTAKCLKEHFLPEDLEKIAIVASIIEYIHTATLLHDDVIDNSSTRRNKQAARMIWGDKASVLVGDYLFTVSFQKLARFKDISMVEFISDTTTTMAKGEILQLTHTIETTNKNTYYKIIECKTSVLFALSTQIGAYLAQGSEEIVNAMHNFGIHFGNAFQIVDDLLDYADSSSVTGKPVGLDLKEKKITLPIILLLEKVNSSEKTLIHNILLSDKVSDDDYFFIKGLLERYDIFQACKKEAENFAQEARANLSQLPKNQYFEKMQNLLDFSVFRLY